MPKKQTAWSRNYNEKAYDRLAVTIPKGCKSTVEAFARERGDSINGVTNKALLAYMGLETWPEKAGESAPDGEPHQQEG